MQNGKNIDIEIDLLTPWYEGEDPIFHFVAKLLGRKSLDLVLEELLKCKSETVKCWNEMKRNTYTSAK